MDSAQAEEPEAAAEFSEAKIGIAGVIDEFGAGTENGTVNRPVEVESSEVILFAASSGRTMEESPACFRAADFFTDIFDDLAAGGNVLRRAHAEAMNSRAEDAKFIGAGSGNAPLGIAGEAEDGRGVHRDGSESEAAAHPAGRAAGSWNCPVAAPTEN